MENFTRKAALAALFTFFGSACTTESPTGDGQEAESEAESESEGDQPCPPEGCETEMPCADDDNCPGDDPCRDYFCDGRDGYCRYTLTDEDGDGYVRASCEGTDCDDRSEEECGKVFDSGTVGEFWNCGDSVHPGAVEDCNGVNDNCVDGIDEELQDQPCGPEKAVGICRVGTRSCQNGRWGQCEGAVGPEEEEVCDGLDNDCDGQVDGFSESCYAVGGCNDGDQLCTTGEWGLCDAPNPTPTETYCSEVIDCTGPDGCPDTDTDCDELRGCWDDDCLGQPCCVPVPGDVPYCGFCSEDESGFRFCCDSEFCPPP